MVHIEETVMHLMLIISHTYPMARSIYLKYFPLPVAPTPVLTKYFQSSIPSLSLPLPYFQTLPLVSSHVSAMDSALTFLCLLQPPSPFCNFVS